MKDNDFVPAKILSKPGETTKEKHEMKTPEVVSGQEPSSVSESAKTDRNGETGAEGESYERILDQFTGQSRETGKSAVVWAKPYDMHINGVFKGLYEANVDRMARDIQGIVITSIFFAYLLIGYYLLAAFFDSDESLAFSKNPYKETSLNDLAKRDDIPFTRQKLTDCVKAAAVDMELRKRGHHFEHLHYEHLLQIGRLKKQEDRLEKAEEANRLKLTSNELRKEIDSVLGKTASKDKQIARSLIRQLRDFVRLASDEDVKDFLEDKERSAVLDHTETAQLLDFSGKFRETILDSTEMLKQLETNLRENFVEKQYMNPDQGKLLSS